MNVVQLKKILNKYPDNMIVVMSSDGEGNSYSPLSDVGVGWYYPESTWRGEFRVPETDDDEMYEEEEIALALWPTN